MKRVGIWVDGLVQGVGFRWWGDSTARELGLTGTVENLWDGRVEFHVQGPEDAVDQMVQRVTGRSGPGRRPGRVASSQVVDEPVVPGEASFEVR